MGVDPSIWVAIISVLGTLTATFGPKLLKALLAGVSKLDEVHEQVKNTHSTNLREDLDVIAELVRGVQADIAGLRQDIRQERQERVDLDARVTTIVQKYHGSE